MMTLFNANQIDRISDLPSNVIDVILGNLRIRDQVRTSILSTKWRYMWTSAPHLYFDDDFYQRFLVLDDPGAVVSKIITDVVMLHNGPIHKFSICIYADFDFKITTEDINLWIPFMSRDVKHLELVTHCVFKDPMPDILFSCKELTYFKCSSFILSIPPNFCGFEKLLELHLVCVEFESSALESLMSGCPFLEKLVIELCGDFEYLDISSPTLKVLLVKLEYDIKSICLKKAKNLVDFTLDANYNSLSGLIKSLPKIKRFSMLRGKKIPLADIIPPTLLTSSFSSLEYLKLDEFNLKERGELLYIVSVLKSAPRLIELTIRQSDNNVDTIQVLDHSEELECSSWGGLKLQTVNIEVEARSQHAMSLIKLILANSPLLKTLTFNYSSEKLGAVMLFRISQDLLLMKRASPRAQVKFLCSTFPPFVW
ncbi:unnamed protein product [Lathyrus oleraceus]|uniref:F-box domain-containing protein n=1 Tax=Pisum sativum TaxID=3888 RepID=A0A9D4XYU8_PEA|nr:F-box/FBD/LRR-repeat protein At1g13570-like [Pisum sativum]XP_050911252.1 F-box/FBD/LRR-repeat protein At1g13570-like [Pisum sativum]XP_050911253.1 F-box/FBD/LRR-repeat protein At1g13570-like [Pisum sativum]KAI5427171.1 hypothetical protein KIW84_032552 [Pisum sativum]